MFSCWVKPFIVKQLCLLVLNHNDNRNYPDDPDQKFTYYGDFGLIMSTQVDTNGFEWLLKITILTCDLFACNQCVCTKSQWVSGLLTDPSIFHPVLHWCFWILRPCPHEPGYFWNRSFAPRPQEWCNKNTPYTRNRGIRYQVTQCTCGRLF